MAMPYDPTWRALLRPAEGAVFFPGGRPADEAALCAELSRLSYVSFERDGAARRLAEAALGSAGFTEVRFFSAGGTECYLAHDPLAALSALAFRGTMGPRDAVTDVLAWRRRWPAGGTVHYGFAGALEHVWPLVLPHLRRRPGRMVYTGHSLGAALATLAASLMAPDTLYTFGSPRVGDAAFVATLRTLPCVRTTDCCDVVCRVPPAWLGYAHLEGNQYADRTAQLHAEPPAAYVRADQAQARGAYRRLHAWRWGNVWTRDLADHAPINYLSALSGRDTDGAPATR